MNGAKPSAVSVTLATSLKACEDEVCGLVRPLEAKRGSRDGDGGETKGEDGALRFDDGDS